MKDGFKILMIEDEEFLGDLLDKKIRAEGHVVDWVTDGKSGLKKAKTGKYDLIILDMILPKLDGFGVLEELKDNDNKTPIMIISNSGQPVDIKRAKKLGAMDYLVKSNFGPPDVISKIHKNLGVKKGSSRKGKKKDNDLILLVEDDEFLRNLISKKLKDRGYNIKVATDGDKGWEEIRSKKPALVLLDIIMPGMNGFQVLEKIKKSEDEQVVDTPVLMLTNLGEHKNSEKAKKLGASDYILKATFSMEDIMNKIDYYLGK